MDSLLDLWIHWCNEYRVSKLLQTACLDEAVRDVGRMNSQVWCLNLLVRLAGRRLSEQWIRCWRVTRNGRCSIQYTMSKCLLNVLPAVHVYFLSLPKSQNREMFLAGIVEITFGNYSPCYTDRRMFGNKDSFSCQSNLPFCDDDEKEIRPNTYRGLPQASHGIIMPFKVCISYKQFQN